MFNISIKTNILTIFLSLVGIVALSLLFLQYYFSEKLAMTSTTKTFNIISKNITEHMLKEAKVTKNILNAKSKHDDILKPITFDPFHPALKNLIQVLQIKSNLYAIYFAQKNGAFYEVVNMKENPIIFKTFNAPKLTKWTIITIINNEQQYAFLDKDLNLIRKQTNVKKYDPRNRPWYTRAVNNKGIISTDPYLFSNLNATGITYAIEHERKGVVIALDYTMEQLNKILALQKFDNQSEIFLVDDNGKKFASSAFSKIKYSEEKNGLSNKETIPFTQEEKEYIKNHSTLWVSNEDNWAPLDFNVAGEPKGYSIDLIKLLSLKSGLKLQFYNGYKWSEIMSMFQKGEIDIVHSLYKTKQREKMGLFSKPIHSLKNYFIVSKSAKEIQSIDDIKKKTVVVVKGWLIETFMKQNYPENNLLVVESVADAFLAMSTGKADVMVDTKESFSYLTKQLQIDNIKLSGWFKKFDNNKAKTIHMMVHKDNHILISILNKTLDSIHQNELELLQQKWFLGSNNSTHEATLDAKLMQVILNKEVNKIIKYAQGDKHYFAKFHALKSNNGFMGIKIDANQLLKPYHDNLRYALVVAFFLLLIALPVIMYSSDLIIKPIKSLLIENEKIKAREFEKVEHIKTRILEFIELSNSQVSMSKSIQAYQRSQEEILDSLIKLIAEAIDAKSPYTGGHCKRVPLIAKLLLDEANKSESETFRSFSMTSKDDLRAFEIGSWLHDCGKVTTPEYVVDKATKLETIYNRIHEIRMRFEVLWRDAIIDHLSGDISEDEMKIRQSQLQDDFAFIASVNIGGEFLDASHQDRVKQIAKQEWKRHFDDRLGLGEVEKLRYPSKDNNKPLPVTEKLLDNKSEHVIPREDFNYEAYEAAGFKEEVPKNLYNYGEIYNLCIEKGTLTDEERYKINEHVIMSIKMLENIPFPNELSRVAEYAGTHHETLIGTGYPRQLSAEDLSIPARIMAIADIFEALTAADRPYKKAKTLSTSIKIMSFMVKDKHIDADLFKLFLSSGVYKAYADEYLATEQIDDVDLSEYLDS